MGFLSLLRGGDDEALGVATEGFGAGTGHEDESSLRRRGEEGGHVDIPDGEGFDGFDDESF